MTTGIPDVDDVIWSGGGGKSAEWPTVGAWVGGPVVARPKPYQAKEYVPGQPGAGRPRLTQSGEQIWGVKVDVQTGQRDPADPKDTGIRRMHLEKWRQIEAIRNALAEAGVRHIEPGGELWVQWTGEERDGQTAQAAKTWTAKYRPPTNSAARITDPLPEAQPAAPTYAPQSAPQSALPPAPAPMPTPAPSPTPTGSPAAPTGPSWGGSVPAFPQSAAPMSQLTTQTTSAPTNVITESVAAALRSQGVDTSAFTVVPG